jgi:hypothetical protein
MLHTIRFIGYAGEVLETKDLDGDRSDVCAALADYPGAAKAEVTDARGRTETIGKGVAFAVVDGPARNRQPVMRDTRKSYNGVKVRAPRSWYGAALLAG